MMFFKIIKIFPAELAHFLTIKILKLGIIKFFFKPFTNNEILKQFIWNLEFNNPLGLAAGFDKNGEVISEILELGFSYTEVGTVTLKPQNGNKKPRIFRLNKDQAIINHLGFNNHGSEKVLKRIKKRYEMKYFLHGIIGLNIGKNLNTDDITGDYIKCIKSLGPYSDYIVINISSPNTPGLRELQNRGKLENLIINIKNEKKLDNQIRNKPLLIKISPDINEEQKRDIALTSLAQGIDGIIIGNTTSLRSDFLIDKNKNKEGGLSGKPLFQSSTNLLKEMYNLTGGKIVLIGVGGIFSGRDAYEKIKAGASLVQMYTGLIYEGPMIIEKINKELVYFLKADGYNNISEAIGTDA